MAVFFFDRRKSCCKWDDGVGVMAMIGNILRIGGTLGCALGIGYMMQAGAENAGPLDARMQQVSSAPLSVSQVKVTALARLHDIELTSAEVPVPEDDGTFATEMRQPPKRPIPDDQANCRITASAKAAPLAGADLSVNAPCHGNRRVTIHHSGLTFTETTDAEGRLRVTVPALTEHAVFIVALDDQHGAVASTQVHDLRAFYRVAVQWDGEAGFQIHALEFGASYGEPGHVWADAKAGGQGKVTHLGNSDAKGSQVAEIYSFPADKSNRSGTIDMTIEAEVTAENCGQTINAQSFELRGTEPLQFRDLTLDMPDCSSIGEFLVLNNLVQDLKIAAK